MRIFQIGLRKTIISIMAIFTGIFIFISLASATFDNTLFNQEFHKKLFNKYDIYANVGKIINTSMQNYLDNIKSASPDNLKQQEQLFSLVANAITPDMLKLNIDSFVDGMMKYFKGEARFLPDIYLHPIQDTTKEDVQTNKDEDDSISAQSLSRINRINLSVILMYLGRNDVADKLSAVKLLEFVISHIRVFFVLLAVLFTLLAVLLTKHTERIKAWFSCAALFAGLSALISAVALIVFSVFYAPGAADILKNSIPLPDNIISNYIRSCIQPAAIVFLISGLFFAALSISIRKLPALPGLAAKSNAYMALSQPVASFAKRFKRINMNKYGKTIVCTVLILLTALFFSVKAEALNTDFHSEDLSVVFDRLQGNGIQTKVVAAKDEVIYSLEVKATDKDTKTPVEGVRMNVSRVSGEDEKTAGNNTGYLQSGTSNKDGISDFTLSKGTFQLNFDANAFPDGYELPSSFKFKINTAGTTFITVNLEKEKEKEPGTAEIEILGKDDKPVGRVELEVEKWQAGINDSGRTYSFSNTDGIAAFSAQEGTYSVVFMESGFPDGYEIPEPVNVNVVSGTTTKYTLKLVPVKTSK